MTDHAELRAAFLAAVEWAGRYAPDAGEITVAEVKAEAQRRYPGTTITGRRLPVAFKVGDRVRFRDYRSHELVQVADIGTDYVTVANAAGVSILIKIDRITEWHPQEA